MVDVTEYERRLLRVFAVRKGVERLPGGVIDDAWLEGAIRTPRSRSSSPSTPGRGCRYVFRCAIWTAIAGASPEAHAYEIDIGLQDWTGTLGSMASAPGSTYELRRRARVSDRGAPARKPGLSPATCAQTVGVGRCDFAYASCARGFR